METFAMARMEVFLYNLLLRYIDIVIDIFAGSTYYLKKEIYMKINES
jgi:hypothetical protein